MSYFTPSLRVLAWITKIHLALYRATGGILGAALPQPDETRGGMHLRILSIVLLTTTGRLSGVLRTVPLPCFVHEGRVLLVASFTGLDRNPAWYLNLSAHPEVEVQLRSHKRRCRAVTLRGAEREQFWEKIARDWPRYRVYQKGTRREIPVVELVQL